MRDQASSDPVLATAEAGRDGDLGVIADGFGDALLDGPGILVKDKTNEPNWIATERLIALLPLASPEPSDQFLSRL